MTHAPRILITRTDRLGDVLMSLQTVHLVRRALPDHAIDFLAHDSLRALLSGILEQWDVEFKAVETLQPQELGAYVAALCLFDEPLLTAQLKKAGVKVRVGNYSKLRSFLNLTHGQRQRRALGAKNEGEYNYDLGKLLLGVLGAEVPAGMPPIQLPIHLNGAAEARSALAIVGVEAGQPYWMAHPGMGGSALNLDAAGYVRLLDSLVRDDRGPLVLTLGPAAADLRLVEAIVDERPAIRILPRVSLPALGEVFRGANLVVAPSTGPLHLAHYVGTRTVGVYSPVRSHQPKRWAPWGGSGKSFVLSPEHACPGTQKCLEKRCQFYYCMERLSLPPGGLPMARGSV